MDVNQNYNKTYQVTYIYVYKHRFLSTKINNYYYFCLKKRIFL